MQRPTILITTAHRPRENGLKRLDVIGGHNYAEAIIQTGGLPIFVHNPEAELAEAYLNKADGLLLSGGADFDPAYFAALPDKQLGYVDAARDAFELALYRTAKRLDKPIFGICRGIQAINIAEGGTLYQHLPALEFTHQHNQHNSDGAPLHKVTLTPDSQLARAFGYSEIATNSYHHQAIAQLGHNLKAVGHTKDGVIEAVEGTGQPFVLGVQWHPEMSFERYPEHLAPFRLFMQAVFARQPELRLA
jgi:putative glutamine amidotransferase